MLFGSYNRISYAAPLGENTETILLRLLVRTLKNMAFELVPTT